MPNPGLDRRSFLKGAALTSVMASTVAREALAEAVGGEWAAPKVKVGGHSGFRSSLYNVSGIPLGGIGTGSIELRPDGYFHDWQIFNTGSWSPEQPDHEKGETPGMGPEGLQFFLRTEIAGKTPQLRRLGLREDMVELYSLSFAKPVEAIEFDGKFPFATMDYVDRAIPVKVTGLAFSPIIPGDARTSGTPGFTVAFKVRNTAKERVKVSLMGALQNPLATGSPDRKLANVVSHAGDTTTVSLTTGAELGRKSGRGSMAFSVTGGTSSHVAGGYRWYLGNGGWGGSRGFGSAYFSYLLPYYRDGRLPSTDRSVSLDGLRFDGLSRAEKQQRVRELDEDPFFREYRARIEEISAGYLDDESHLDRYLAEAAARINGFSGEKRERSSWGDTALETTIELAPGEEREVRFTLSWFFPNHFSAYGPNMGHMYENWFTNAREVNEYLVKNHSEHRKAVVSFAETMLATNLEREISFAWGAQLTTLIKSSWWTKDGRFAMWEGLGCCGLHTTDITYQGSFNLIALFPELQKGQMAMGAGYQRADGRIHHFFAPDLLHVDNGFDRVDMNPQFVMMVCRDYLWTGDREYLAKLWPNVARAMASTQQLDGDNDGIPDRDTRRNTYDQWDLEGSPAYICSLWLGALAAAVRIARELGHPTEATAWQATLDKGRVSFVNRLWNGEYFNLWVSDTDRDECCMSDQLSGEWYTSLMGIGHALPTEKVVAALRAVNKHNFDQERGLINASYPAGRKKHFKTHQNLQAAGNWTGIEYANAAMMIDFGLVEEGFEVIRTVYDRHVRTGHRWNHVECGDHYYRAMSSWSTLLAVTGFKVDRAKGSITIAPKVDNLVAPWFVPGAYGVLARRGKRYEIEVKSGELAIGTLRLPGRKLVAFSRGALPEARSENGILEITLPPDFRLKVGDRLQVQIA